MFWGKIGWTPISYPSSHFYYLVVFYFTSKCVVFKKLWRCDKCSPLIPKQQTLFIVVQNTTGYINNLQYP